MRKLDLSSLQASSTSPASSSNLPTWGQLKELTRQAQQMVFNTGQPSLVENMFLALLAIVTLQVYPASAASFWAYVPHPPLLHPMGWGDDVNIRVMTNDSGLMG